MAKGADLRYLSPLVLRDEECNFGEDNSALRACFMSIIIERLLNLDAKSIVSLKNKSVDHLYVTLTLTLTLNLTFCRGRKEAAEILLDKRGER